MGEAGQAGLRLASFNNFRGLWGIGVVPSYLVRGLGVTKTGR